MATRTLAKVSEWINDHVQGHVLSGHKHDDSYANVSHSHPAGSHNHDVAYSKLSHTHPSMPADVLTEAEVALLRGMVGSPVPQPTPVDPPPVDPPDPPSGTPIPLGSFRSMITAATPGTTYVPDPGTHDLGSSGTPVNLTAAGVSIIGNEPAPLIKPAARPNGLFIVASDTTVRSLAFGANQGTYNDGLGSALLEVVGTPSRVYDTLIENVSFVMPSLASSQQHCLYLRNEVERFTARNIVSNGNGGRAVGFHGYHDGASPSRDIVIEDWVFSNHYDAVLLWLNIANLTIRRCDFIGTASKDIRVRTGGTVLIEDCRGSKGILNEGSSVTESGNNWSWTP